MEVLIVLGIVLFICICISSVVLIDDYKYYSRTYKELPKMKFYINGPHIYNSKYGEPRGEFVWFVESNDFKVGPWNYVHNNLMTYLSPYSLYWLIKYKNWFKKNVNIETLEKY